MKHGAAWILIAAQLGCATVRDVAVTTLNGAADFALEAEHVLEDLDRAEQQACLAQQAPAPCVADVRARYRRAWVAYRAFRAAWLQSAAAIRSYDAKIAAGETPPVAALLASVKSLAQAEQAFADAAAELEAHP